LLPEGNRTQEELVQMIRSPQFLQAMNQFNNALESGQLTQLMPAWGLPSAVGGPRGGVAALARALHERAQRTPQTPTPTQQEEKKDDTKQDEDKKDDKKDDNMDDSA